MSGDSLEDAAVHGAMQMISTKMFTDIMVAPCSVG